MITLDVSADFDRLERSLLDMEKRQLPFAISQALTSTAFDVRKQLVDRTWPRSVDVRDARFINAALRVDKASKRILVAGVYDRLERDFLERQARGGIKTGRGHDVAIPTERVKARRGARGVPKSLRPRQVLDKPTGFVKAVRGKRVVFRRVGGKRNPKVEALYTLVPAARVRRSFPAYRDARDVVGRRIGKHFHTSFERAMRTARAKHR